MYYHNAKIIFDKVIDEIFNIYRVICPTDQQL